MQEGGTSNARVRWNSVINKAREIAKSKDKAPERCETPSRPSRCLVINFNMIYSYSARTF